MFDHVDFAVVDLEASRKFYTAVLATLGIEPFMNIKTEEGREGTGYGSLTGEQFWIGKGPPVNGRMHIAFAADSRASVDAFYNVALESGGEAKGAPGIRST